MLQILYRIKRDQPGYLTNTFPPISFQLRKKNEKSCDLPSAIPKNCMNNTNYEMTKLSTFLFLAFTITLAQLQARTWTQQATGKTIEAEYQGTTGEGEDMKVILRMPRRGTVPYLVSALSEADQQWIAEQLTKAKDMEDANTDGAEGDGSVLGTWKGYMANSSGEPDSPIELEFTEDTVTARRFSGEVMGTGTYRVRGSGKMRIDVEGTTGEYEGKDYEGVISVEGNTLKWCSTNDNPSAKRPREFQTDIQQNHFLMVLERES